MKFGVSKTKVHLFDKQDAPAMNIYDIFSSQIGEETSRKAKLGNHEILETTVTKEYRKMVLILFRKM